MSKITFIYMRNIYQVNIKTKEILFADILCNYAKVLGEKVNEIYFFYNGKKISINRNIKLSKMNKNIRIFVYSFKNKKNKKDDNNSLIMCPTCKKSVRIIINDDKISTYYCENKHSHNDMEISIFMEHQYMNNNFICCNICGNFRFYYDKIYICSCNLYICPLCYQSHDKSHKKIEFKNRFSYCCIHCLEFISYCNTCFFNLCQECEKQHIKHKIITYKSIKPNDKDVNRINNDFREFNKKIDIYRKELIKLQEHFSDFIPNIIKELDNYIKLYSNIFNSFYLIKNYESLRNIFNVKYKKLYKEINTLLNEENSKNKFKYLIDTFYNLKNEMNIIYKKNGKNIIRLFGSWFVLYNQDNCYFNN